MLFETGLDIYGGFAYDRTANTLWVSSAAFAYIGEFTMSGEQRRNIATGHYGNHALALDPRRRYIVAGSAASGRFNAWAILEVRGQTTPVAASTGTQTR
jgi:hypothetical protein